MVRAISHSQPRSAALAPAALGAGLALGEWGLFLC
jgi:hypothetical protein